MTEHPDPAAGAPPVPRARSRWFRARHEVVWLFLIALGLRAVAAWTNPSILNDSVSLVRGAERVAREGLAAALAGPDHPLAAWLVSVLPMRFGVEAAATALCVFAGAFAVWPLHVLARRACGRHAATAAAIVYAALPKAIGVSSVPLTSAVLLPLFLSSLSLAVAAGLPASPRRRIVRLVSAGTVAGLSYLCRPEGLVAAAGAVAAALLLVRRGRRLASGAIVAAVFVLVAAPYAIALSRDAGHVVLSPKKDVARFVGAAEVPVEARDAASAAQDAASGLEGALTVPVILLVLAGAFLPGRWRHARSTLPRALLVGLAAVSIGLVVRLQLGWGYGGARHVLPGALLLLPFAGEGFLFLGAFISRVIARRRLAVVLASFLAIPCAVKAVLRPEGEDLADARHLGERIAAAAAASGTTDVAIGSFREPLVAYYADRALRAHGGAARDVPLWGAHRALLDRSDTEGRRAELARALRGAGAQWLVLDLFRATIRPTGETVLPERRLAERLAEDGVIGTPVTAAGSPLAAFPVAQRP